MKLGAKLKQLRIKNNKSLQDVADAVGSSKAHIWDLEKGNSSNPTMELLLKLATFFKVGVADLVGENPNAREENPEMVAMYRDLKTLTDDDRKMLQVMIEQFKSRK